MDASGRVYGLNVRFVALLGHFAINMAIFRILANNHDLSKILLGHPTIIRILANSSNF